MWSKHKIIKLQVAINAVSEQKVAEIQNNNNKTQLDIVLEISQHPPREYASEQVGLVRTH